MKGVVVCCILTALAWLGAGVNLGMFIARGEAISLVAFLSCCAMAAFTSYNTFSVSFMEGQMRELKRRRS